MTSGKQYFANLRQDYITAHIKKHGRINRADLEKQFGIGTVQASRDIQRYISENPDAIKYDTRQRAYFKAS